MFAKSHSGNTPKKETIERLLHRGNGATIADMIKVTDWQSHSIRATLSRLRKMESEIHRTSTGSGVS